MLSEGSKINKQFKAGRISFFTLQIFNTDMTEYGNTERNPLDWTNAIK